MATHDPPRKNNEQEMREAEHPPGTFASQLFEYPGQYDAAWQWTIELGATSSSHQNIITSAGGGAAVDFSSDRVWLRPGTTSGDRCSLTCGNVTGEDGNIRRMVQFKVGAVDMPFSDHFSFGVLDHNEAGGIGGDVSNNGGGDYWFNLTTEEIARGSHTAKSVDYSQVNTIFTMLHLPDQSVTRYYEGSTLLGEIGNSGDQWEGLTFTAESNGNGESLSVSWMQVTEVPIE